jgi:hypothetical protein
MGAKTQPHAGRDQSCLGGHCAGSRILHASMILSREMISMPIATSAAR